MEKVDTTTLILRRSQVEALITMKEAIESVRDVFGEHHYGRTKTYPRIHIPFDRYEGTIGYLEAAVDNLDASASKIVGLYHKNPSKLGLPRILAVIVLNRSSNGLPLAVMDGTYLTMLRTGAVAAVAAEILARKDSVSAGIVGAGVQGRGQLQGLVEVRGIKKVMVYDIIKPTADSFAREMGKQYGLDVEVADSVLELGSCDIIASATPSRTPVITKDLLHEGLHINSVGIGAGLGKEELDFAQLKSVKTVVDDMEVARMDALGEAYKRKLFSDSNVYATLGQLVAGEKEGRRGNEVTLFVSSGMAIQDVAVAELVYRKAVAEGVGEKVDLFA